jgi:hypothetical protein
MSLEVAEHLPEASSKKFIESLTRLSDFILFSAAIPFQTGENHINEQWPCYWDSLFRQHGFTAVDALRKKIWHDPNVGFWYRQNIMLFVKQEKLNLLTGLQNDFCIDNPPMSLVHPELLLMYVNATKNQSKRLSLKSFLKKLKLKFMK